MKIRIVAERVASGKHIMVAKGYGKPVYPEDKREHATAKDVFNCAETLFRYEAWRYNTTTHFIE